MSRTESNIGAKVTMAKMMLAKATYISKLRVGKLSQGTNILTRVAAAQEIEVATLVRLKNVLEVHFSISP